MKLLKEVFHNKSVNTDGRTISREAVRGIIMVGSKLLMIYSQRNGDYKFPGGGIKPGETHRDALIREIQEESGAEVVNIINPFGKVIEYDVPIEKDHDLFQMTSYYYVCEVGVSMSEQNLDQYEMELGFVPVWVTLDTAIRENRSLLQDPHRQAPRWTTRDLAVLELIQVFE